MSSQIDRLGHEDGPESENVGSGTYPRAPMAPPPTSTTTCPCRPADYASCSEATEGRLKQGAVTLWSDKLNTSQIGYFCENLCRGMKYFAGRQR
jgi:hypothetical protein